MADRSAIEWTDATWNPIRARSILPRQLKNGDLTEAVGWHCEHVSEACRNCYSESFNRRLGTGLAFKPGNRHAIDIFIDDEMLVQPLRWRRPRRIFVCSMTDLFADFVTDEMLNRLFAVMALCPHHSFQVLTKRPERALDYLSGAACPGLRSHAVWRAMYGTATTAAAVAALDAWYGGPLPGKQWPLPNVWLGTSVEDQATTDARVPLLLMTPAAKRFLSCEPLLGPVDVRWALGPAVGIAAGILQRGFFSPGLETLRPLDQIIAGGESGRNARKMLPFWPRSLRDQCADAGAAFFFKQWGAWAPLAGASPPDTLYLTTKKQAGRLLDGVTHDGMPA